jgi:hypothetical protein
LKAFDLGYHFPTRLAALRLIVAGPTSTSEARDFMTAFDSKRRLRPPAPKAPLSARHEWALRLSGLRAPGIGSLPFALLAVLICLVLPVESVPRLPAPSDIFDLPEFAEPDPDGQDQQNPKDPEQSDTPDPSQGADGGQQDQGADGVQQGQGTDGKEGGGPSQLTFPGTGTEASDGPSLPLTPSPEGTQEDAMILTTRQSVFAPAGHARPVLEIPMPEPSDALTVNTSPIPPRQKLPGWIGELYDLP